MTQEYKGEEFRKPFCEALAKGPVEWQWLDRGEWISHNTMHLPIFEEEYTYRFKPLPKRMVTMYDKHGKPHQLVAPEREAPQRNACIFIADPFAPVAEELWLGADIDKKALEANLVFLTREDAQAMGDFQCEQREGV